MRYLLLICSNGVVTPEKRAVMPTATQAWVEEMDGRGVRLFGDQLQGPQTAVTVRTRGGEVFTSDGPFIEAKEFVAGIDILECEDLDEAIEVAAKHPVSWFDVIEIRPFIAHRGSDKGIGELPSGEHTYTPAPGRRRYLMLMSVNGVAEPDEEEAAVRRNSERWGERLAEDGTFLFGGGLQGAEAATTVRVRDGQTLVSDGPFVEAKEFIAGMALVECASREEAVAHAGAHPLAHYHHVEVRPFVD